MLWTADSVEYRSVSMDAAFSGDTLIWLKDHNTGYKLTKITSVTATPITTSDTLVIGCPDYGTFVTDSLFTITFGTTSYTNCLLETSERTIRGAYIDDTSGLLLLKPSHISSSVSPNYRTWRVDVKTPNYENKYVGRGTKTHTKKRLFVQGGGNQAVDGWLDVQEGTGRLAEWDSVLGEMVYLAAGHSQGDGQGLYKDLYYEREVNLTTNKPCYLFKVQSV